MKDGTEYTRIVKSFYSFLESDFGLNLDKEIINGNAFYDVEYKDKEKVVSISYENIEDHLEIIVFKLQKGIMPDYDDKSKTLHLKHINSLVMPKIGNTEIVLNNEYFSTYKANDVLERKLLKGAKELRLCLKYFEEIFGID